ncbi:MAG: adenosine kinase [Gammaproteobacteria bacterium]|nr:adenosine kinase [Gammaproteobacteria bacterium]|tara:strand:+ start:13676 stop:14659 length:984 start_codon:yes stop_codon:yes gene_type:complete
MIYSEQLLGISNAIVDILGRIDKKFLGAIGAPLGSMTLIDEEQAEKLYSLLNSTEKISGGSVANTIAGFANLGGKSSYIGKVHDDAFGNIFNNDMKNLGVDIRLKPTKFGKSTARSHILISEGGQRTMQTYLGACLELCLSDIDSITIKKPKIILLEGYVWDIEDGPALAKKAAEIGRANNATIAMSLSDSFCVERHRNEFEIFVKNEANIVFADEDEINALFGTKNSKEIINKLSKLNILFVITRAEKGSIIIRNDHTIFQDALDVKEIIDTTGAGDAYAAGFLFGFVNNHDLSECAKYGTYCATKVIQQLGARINKGILNDLMQV